MLIEQIAKEISDLDEIPLSDAKKIVYKFFRVTLDSLNIGEEVSFNARNDSGKLRQCVIKRVSDNELQIRSD